MDKHLLPWGTMAIIGALFFATANPATAADPITLLNVSYDPTRELYDEFNKAFTQYWQQRTGQKVSVRQSHGGSGKQARAVIDGLEADVVTLAIAYDIDAIAQAGLIQAGWEGRLQNRSSPYTSTIVFLVRKGNPKGIRDWNDLIRPGVQVITPNPKTSGGARLNYLAAWSYALAANQGDENKTRAFVQALFKNVPVLDSGARGATITFADRGIGDVLIAWENEALLAVDKLGGDQLEVVVPSTSILAEPKVSLVDTVVDKRGTRAIAQAYLEFLYSDVGQKIAAKHYYRPIAPAAAKLHTGKITSMRMVTIDDAFSGWKQAQATHFADGGMFDRLYKPGR